MKKAKMVPKILAFLLAVAMIPVISPSNVFALNAQPKSDTGVVTITYAQWGNDVETKATEAVAAKFNSSQKHIKVQIMQIDHDSYITKLNAMATARQLPDTAIMSEAGVLTFANNGMLADISKMYGTGEAKPLSSLAFKSKGKTVAYSAANEVLNLWYNIDLLKKVCKQQGLNVNDYTPPATAAKAWSWSTFVKKAKALTVDANGKNANDPKFNSKNISTYGTCVNTLSWQTEVWPLSNGGGYYSKDGSKCIINQAASTQAIQAVADLFLKDHCAPQPSSSSGALSTSLGSQKIVMATDGTWNVGTYLGPDAKFKYGVGVLPYFKTKVTICTGGPNVVFATTKHAAEAMTWLKWYAKEENSWDLIKAGTWMPTLSSWYTETAKTNKWIDNKNYPSHAMYKSAVVDYARNNSKSTAWYYVAGTDVFNSTLDTVLSHVWNGDMTAKAAITKYYPQLNQVFQNAKGK